MIEAENVIRIETYFRGEELRVKHGGLGARITVEPRPVGISERRGGLRLGRSKLCLCRRSGSGGWTGRVHFQHGGSRTRFCVVGHRRRRGWVLLGFELSFQLLDSRPHLLQFFQNLGIHVRGFTSRGAPGIGVGSLASARCGVVTDFLAGRRSLRQQSRLAKTKQRGHEGKDSTTNTACERQLFHAHLRLQGFCQELHCSSNQELTAHSQARGINANPARRRMKTVIQLTLQANGIVRICAAVASQELAPSLS
jgi:hypothetical protein